MNIGFILHHNRGAVHRPRMYSSLSVETVRGCVRFSGAVGFHYPVTAILLGLVHPVDQGIGGLSVAVLGDAFRDGDTVECLPVGTILQFVGRP